MSAITKANFYFLSGLHTWSVVDVAAWLNSISMAQYASAFSQNEITGPILLDLSLEDLDYMGITILGHRKTILNGIEELRICQTNAAVPHASASKSNPVS